MEETTCRGNFVILFLYHEDYFFRALHNASSLFLLFLMGKTEMHATGNVGTFAGMVQVHT